MDIQSLKTYFSSDYKGINSIIKEVFIPIFGEENFEEGFDVLTRGDTAFSRKVKEHKIISISYNGKFYTEDLELNIYDVTLDSSARIVLSRVGIRQVVAEMVDSFDGALVVFHYAGNTNRSWRLSYIEKIKGMQKKAKRFTYLCGQNYSCRTIAERFMELAHASKNAKALEAAFSVEALSDEFFAAYKKQYEIFCQYIEDNKFDATRFGVEFTLEEGKYIRDYVKKMMGRITFLCFLQRRGWLGVPTTEKEWVGGDMQFVYNLFRKSTPEQKENFLDEVLEPLFFDCLNEKREGDIYDTKVSAIGKVKIPYLNGGLFDREQIDEFRSVFPAELFYNLFEFFASYNFTIDENDPDDAEVGVDPEMLGKIFENLLEDNKDKGAFYTPKEIVQYMCRESLIAYLIDEAKRKAKTTENFEDAIRTFVADPEISVQRISQYYKEEQLQDLSKSLEEVRVCDLAIGSGAFPMGLLNLIYRCRLFLNKALGTKKTAAKLKQEIIQNNIYGVDIEKGAIDIARLRFWLSIIVDAETPEPLPNFDYKFMQGNSLLEWFDGLDLRELLPKEEENNGLRLIFSDEQAQYEILKNYQTQYFKEDNHIHKYQLREKINQTVKNLIMERTQGRNDIASALNSINVAGNTQFFLWHTWFADVFNRAGKSGFDIVIGNPPYIKEYTNRAAFDGFREQSPYYMGKMDLWYGFACHGIDLLRKNGVLCFIAQNNWTTSAGAKKMRKKVIEDCQILQMLDFNTYMVFESAGIQTMIMLFKRDSQTDGYRFDYRTITRGNEKEDMIALLNKQAGNNNFLTPLIERASAANKLLTFSESEYVFEKIARGMTYLQDDEATNGIHTHHDCVSNKIHQEFPDLEVGKGIFVLSPEEKNRLHLTREEESLVKPFFTSNEISRYWTSSQNVQWIIYTTSEYKDEHSLDNYPNIKAHLDVVKKAITSDNKPYGLHRAREQRFFTGEKIVSLRKCVERPCFSYSDFDCYVPAMYYIIQTSRWNMKFLTGVLNSKLIAFWLRHKGKMQGSNFQVDKEPLLNIPLPLIDLVQQQPIIDLVDTILNKKKANPQANISAEERAIDNIVYSLYGLNEAERDLIEGENQ